MQHSTARQRLLCGAFLKHAVLAFVLIAAELFAAAHPLDLAAHANGEACAVCVGVASLGGVAPRPAVAPAVVTHRTPAAPAAAVAGPAHRPLIAAYPRGPPTAS